MVLIAIFVIDMFELSCLLVLVAMHDDRESTVAQKATNLLQIRNIRKRLQLLSQARRSEMMVKQRDPELSSSGRLRGAFDQST
ncbi:hypothetical protein OO17_09680 [Rhodopseudomonas palustris]|uniref:Uncharacterized protein n=1 Tax=Rhodopseudomonas palustris TaxID=1076 RepID=A0A0D7EVD1_RHOPL|nr:hypothetical protein OO17_09680 [Rhodopseudomonas palustris]